jgi:hypothetical protein
MPRGSLGENDLINLPSGYGGFPDEKPDPVTPTVPAPGIWDSMGAAFRLYNTLGSATSLPQNYPQSLLKPSAQFDPAPYIPADKKQYASAYAYANTLQEVEAVTARIEQEELDRRNFAASGALGVVGAIGFGILDPVNYAIPVFGNAGKGRGLISVLRNGATHAAVGLGTVSLQSALLHQTQVTRTLGESANDIAIGTFLSGLLGVGVSSAVEGYLALKGVKAKNMTSMKALLEKDLNVPRTGRYVPAEVAQVEAASKQALQTLESLKTQGVTAEAPEYIQAALKAKETGTRLETMLDDIHELDPLEPGYFEIPESALLEDTAPGGNGSATGKALEAQIAAQSTDGTIYQKAPSEIPAGAPVDVPAVEAAVPETPPRQFVDYLGVGEEAPAAVKTEPRTGQGSEGPVSGVAGQADPGTASPRNTDLGNGDTLGDPIAYETADGWEEVYSAKQMGFPDEALNAANLDERLKDHSFIEKLPLTNRQDPLIRTQLSPSIETRRTVQRLVETPLKYEKNALGVATEVPAEALARQYKAPLAFSLKHLDDLFVEYRTGAAKAGGKAMALVQDAMGGVEGKLSFDEFKQAVGKAMRQGDVHSIPQVAQAAQNFRRMVFDPLKDQAIRLGVLPAGVETETAATYLTRVWDVERIAAQRDEFYQLNLDWLKQKESLLEPAARRSNADLEDIADQIIDRILGTPEGRLPYDLLGEELGAAERSQGGGGGSKGLSKPLKERVYDIPDEWVEDYLHNDIEHVAKIYERSMASDLALLERFGSVDLQPEIQAIRRDYAAKAKVATDNKARLQLKRKMDSDIRDVAAMRDRIRGIYGMPADPSSTFVRAGKVLRSLNFLSLMGGVTLSSLADLARPMMVHGLQRYLTDGLVPLVSNFKAFRVAAEEVKLANTALDMILESRAAGIAELMDDFGRGSKAERLLHGVASMYGKMTGLSQWTATMKQWTGVMTQSRMIRAALNVQAGTVGKKELQNLAASYIDPDMAKRIAQQFEKHGERNGAVLLPNTVKWTDREAVKLFRAGLAKEVDKIIVTPGAGDKPLWLSSEWGKLLGQFKSFFVSAQQRVLLSGLQDRDLGVLNGAVFATSLGVATTLLQSKLSGRKISMEPADLILEGVDRAGLMGWLFEMNGTVEKLTRGHYGLSRLTGKEPMSRFASRNITDSLLGPSVGRVEDFAKITGALAGNEWKASDARALRRLLPFQNLFYVRQVFDKAQEGFMNVMGIEDTREAKSE